MKLPHSLRAGSAARGFTLLELLTVMTIIVALAAITIKGMGYAQQRSGLARAQAEIAAMSAALESYKADNGEYPPSLDIPGTPGSSAGTGFYNGASGITSTAYISASRTLYRSLAGWDTSKVYMPFKKTQLNDPNAYTAQTNQNFIVDPFGNIYGYSTRGVFNPTFDLWCTGGKTYSASPSAADMEAWVKNW